MTKRNLLFLKYIPPSTTNLQHGLCVLSESGVFMAKTPTKLWQHNPGDYNMKAPCWCHRLHFLACTSPSSSNPGKTKQKTERKKDKGKDQMRWRKGKCCFSSTLTPLTEGERHPSWWLSQVRESHQRLRIFGIIKTFSSEFGSPEHLQKITDIRRDIMIHHRGKPDQLDPTQTSFKTPVMLCSLLS